MEFILGNADAGEDGLEDLVDVGGNFASRSRIRNFTVAPTSSRSMTEFLIVWVTLLAVGS